MSCKKYGNDWLNTPYNSTKSAKRPKQKTGVLTVSFLKTPVFTIPFVIVPQFFYQLHYKSC